VSQTGDSQQNFLDHFSVFVVKVFVVFAASIELWLRQASYQNVSFSCAK
jgi:hypothetical protein